MKGRVEKGGVKYWGLVERINKSNKEVCLFMKGLRKEKKICFALRFVLVQWKRNHEPTSNFPFLFRIT